jgi:tyrosyl-tRNA synthetase
MDIESKLELIRSEPLEEIVTQEEMRRLLETNDRPTHYIGFEISGMPHLGHLFVAGKKINDLAQIGVQTQVLLADWHTMANNKFGGDWEKIIKASAFYKKMFNIYCPKTKVVLGSELYHNNDDYWKNIIQMARRTTMSRATRTLIIQGRSEKDILHVSQYIYPIMQANDINALGVDIPHAGIDQRKAHMLAIELFKDMKLRKIVPIHHHLLPSLKEPPKLTGNEAKDELVTALKMSKSLPGSGISVMDTDEQIAKATKSAWCPEKTVEGNPVLEWCRFLVLPVSKKLKVERKKEHGGDVEYTEYARLEEDFGTGKLHPVDLKNATAMAIMKMVAPVRDKFTEKDVEIFKEAKITR